MARLKESPDQQRSRFDPTYIGQAPSRMLPTEDEIDLFDCIEVIVRWRWMVFWTTAIFALASFGYQLRPNPSYRAEAYVLPSQERDLKLNTASAELVRRSGQYMEALRGIPIGFGMLSRTVPRLADGQPDSVWLQDYFDKSNVKQALDGLNACSEFKQDASGVLTISVTLKDPIMAAAVANAYVEELILFFTEKQHKQAQNDVEFIETRMNVLKEELKTAEDSLVGFQRANVSIGDPALSLQLIHLQRQVDLKSRLHGTMAEQYELARIEARKEMPSFEVLNYARADGIKLTASSKSSVLIGTAAGLFLSIFLAFFLEYITRNRKLGRMEPMASELRKDIERVKDLFKKET